MPRLDGAAVLGQEGPLRHRGRGERLPGLQDLGDTGGHGGGAAVHAAQLPAVVRARLPRVRDGRRARGPRGRRDAAGRPLCAHLLRRIHGAQDAADERGSPRDRGRRRGAGSPERVRRRRRHLRPWRPRVAAALERHVLGQGQPVRGRWTLDAAGSSAGSSSASRTWTPTSTASRAQTGPTTGRTSRRRKRGAATRRSCRAA